VRERVRERERERKREREREKDENLGVSDGALLLDQHRHAHHGAKMEQLKIL